MQVGKYAAVLAICVTGGVIAQTPVPPQALPRSVGDPARDKPADPAKVREAAIKALTEELRKFDPGSVQVRQVEGRWQVWGGKERLKDFGPDRAAATEAARTIQDLRVNQLGTVPGSSPEFEYWLIDGKPAQSANGQLLVIPLSAPMLRAEQVGGAWIVTDGLKSLYDFGADGEAARRAATVYWKYGFNRLGVVGSPRPAMVYPLFDPAAVRKGTSTPLPPPSPLAVADDVARTSLLLPGNVYGGPKKPIYPAKLRVVKEKGEWLLAHADDVVARFGASEMSARSALRAVQDAKPTEVARLGGRGVPLFLAAGNPIRGEPLGVSHQPINPDRMKVQKVRDAWWVYESSRPVLEVGTKADADLVLLAMKAFQLRSFSMIGRPESGGMPFLTTGR